MNGTKWNDIMYQAEESSEIPNQIVIFIKSSGTFMKISKTENFSGAEIPRGLSVLFRSCLNSFKNFEVGNF